MKIVVKNVYENPKVMEIKGTLENLKEIVGGYIKCFPVFENVLCVCNEEGKLLGLPQNFMFKGFGNDEVIAGNVFFCAGVEEEFASLTDEQIDTIMRIFRIK